MLALGLSFLLFGFWTLVGQAVFSALKIRLGVLRSWLLAPSVGLSVVVLLLMVFNQAGWPIGRFARPIFGQAERSEESILRWLTG